MPPKKRRSNEEREEKTSKQIKVNGQSTTTAADKTGDGDGDADGDGDVHMIPASGSSGVATRRMRINRQHPAYEVGSRRTRTLAEINRFLILLVLVCIFRLSNGPVLG